MGSHTHLHTGLKLMLKFLKVRHFSFPITVVVPSAKLTLCAREKFCARLVGKSILTHITEHNIPPLKDTSSHSCVVVSECTQQHSTAWAFLRNIPPLKRSNNFREGHLH